MKGEMYGRGKKGLIGREKDWEARKGKVRKQGRKQEGR